MNINIGKGLTIAVDTAKLGLGEINAVASHVVAIGLRNILMDSHASITKADNPDDYAELSLAKATDKLEAMYRGDIRVARQSSGTSRDPVRAEALKLARRIVNSVFAFAPKTSEWKIKDKDQWIEIKAEYGSDYDFNDPEQLRDVHDLLTEAVADTQMDAAEKIVAERSNAPKVSLAGLGLVKK